MGTGLNVINVGYPLEDILFKFENVRLSNAIVVFVFFFVLVIRFYLVSNGLGKGSYFSWNYVYLTSDNWTRIT